MSGPHFEWRESRFRKIQKIQCDNQLRFSFDCCHQDVSVLFLIGHCWQQWFVTLGHRIAEMPMHFGKALLRSLGSQANYPAHGQRSVSSNRATQHGVSVPTRTV